MDINIGDEIITKKPHPCGGNRWVVTRTGADIKMQCTTCSHVVMIDRCQCEKRIKKLIKVQDQQ